MRDILNWTGHLKAEEYIFDKPNFHITEPVKRLIFQLEHLDQQLFAIFGFSGIGKSETLNFLRDHMDKFYAERDKNEPPNKRRYNVSFKWQLRETLWNMLQQDAGLAAKLYQTYKTNIFDLYFCTSKGKRIIEFRAQDSAAEHRGTLKYSDGELEEAKKRFKHEKNFAEVESQIPVYVRKKQKQSIALGFLADASDIFIDFTDFGAKDHRLIDRGITEIAKLWAKLNSEGCVANIIYTIQHELYRRGGSGHFFIRKGNLFFLKHLPPNELVEHYKTIFGTAEPFAEEALSCLASLSRGIYRRFKRYIGVCISTVSDRTITIDDVKTLISADELMADMHLELSGIFRDEMLKAAVDVIRILHEVGSANQKTIAEQMNMSEAAISRLMSRLRLYDYVKITRGAHGEHISSLA